MYYFFSDWHYLKNRIYCFGKRRTFYTAKAGSRKRGLSDRQEGILCAGGKLLGAAQILVLQRGNDICTGLESVMTTKNCVPD